MTRSVTSALKVITVSLILACIVRVFIAEPFHIPSGSMKPNLLVGDYVFSTKFDYGYSAYSFPIFSVRGKIIKLVPVSGRIAMFGEPLRGDIVVFRPEKSPNLHFVKRVIGVPGDKIRIINNEVFINDSKLLRERIEDYQEMRGGKVINIPQYLEHLPGGSAHKILVDNSKSVPYFYQNTPVYRVPPEHFFVMGDNRNDSHDSRVIDDIGFIPIDNIIGAIIARPINRYGNGWSLKFFPHVE